MALITCDFFSDVLELSTSMTVILPQRTTSQIGLVGSAPTGDRSLLYLLHGLSDDHTIWVRRTSIERYVAPLGLTVIMPQVHRSFYADEHSGNRFWTFLSEELPALVEDFFNLAPPRDNTFVAGLSMGGYGAFKWALRKPERFAAAASLSGALDIAGIELLDPRPPLMRQIFGTGPVRGTDDDLLWLLDRPDPGGNPLPALYACCGDDDPLVWATQAFADAADRNSIAVTVDIGPGEHEWGYWDRKIQDVLAWLPLD